MGGPQIVQHDSVHDRWADQAGDRVALFAEDGDGNRETYTFADLRAEADVIIEDVPEDMALKKEVFADLDDAAPEDTAFASNTSTMSITELSEATDPPSGSAGCISSTHRSG